MDETVMLAWVDQVVQPYVNTTPEDIIPILILDSYRCHMMASVVQKIQELGVEVKHIPGGCTSLCQPVNGGFNSLTTMVTDMRPLFFELRDSLITFLLFVR